MNVQEWFQSRKGQPLLVPGANEADRGQCMQAADYALHEVYGLPYIWTEGAIDWWNNFDSIPQLKDNFVKITDGSITEGSFVIFTEKVGSKFGHIDIAAADGSSAYFTGFDSNWGGDKTLHEVIHQGAQFVLGSLRFKGVDMQADLDLMTYKFNESQKALAVREEQAHNQQAQIDLLTYQLGESQKAIASREAQAKEYEATIAKLQSSAGFVQVGTIDNQPIYKKAV